MPKLTKQQERLYEALKSKNQINAIAIIEQIKLETLKKIKFNDHTPLELATEYNLLNVCVKLINLKVEVSSYSIYQAVLNSNERILTLLLREVNINMCNKSFPVPLEYQSLIKKYDTNEFGHSKMDKLSIFEIALIKNDKNIIKLLVESKIDMNYSDIYKPPSIYFTEDLEISRLLIEKGAPIKNFLISRHTFDSDDMTNSNDANYIRLAAIVADNICMLDLSFDQSLFSSPHMNKVKTSDIILRLKYKLDAYTKDTGIPDNIFHSSVLNSLPEKMKNDITYYIKSRLSSEQDIERAIEINLAIILNEMDPIIFPSMIPYYALKNLGSEGVDYPDRKKALDSYNLLPNYKPYQFFKCIIEPSNISTVVRILFECPDKLYEIICNLEGLQLVRSELYELKTLKKKLFKDIPNDIETDTEIDIRELLVNREYVEALMIQNEIIKNTYQCIRVLQQHIDLLEEQNSGLINIFNTDSVKRNNSEISFVEREENRKRVRIEQDISK